MSEQEMEAPVDARRRNRLSMVFLTSESVGGWIAVAVGVVSLIEGLRLGMGSMTRMGAGAFPFGVGVLLLVIGGSLIVDSFRRGGAPANIPVRVSTLLVLAALASFAALLPAFGLVPAALVLMLLASAAVTGRLDIADLVFAALTSAAAVLVFVSGLGLALPIARWPF